MPPKGAPKIPKSGPPKRKGGTEPGTASAQAKVARTSKASASTKAKAEPPQGKSLDQIWRESQEAIAAKKKSQEEEAKPVSWTSLMTT